MLKTPNIDKFAKESTHLNQFIVSFNFTHKGKLADGARYARKQGNNLGYWDVSSQAGTYKVSVAHPKSLPGTVLHLKYNGTEIEKKMHQACLKRLLRKLI